MLREINIFGFFDLEPVLGPALSGVAVLLLFRHVRSAEPVFVRSFALQMLQHIALHLPGDFSWAAVLSDPLLPRDAFPQQGEGEKHDGRLALEEETHKETQTSECLKVIHDNHVTTRTIQGIDIRASKAN